MLIPGENYRHLPLATDIEFMKRHLENGLSEAWDRPVVLHDFFVPKVLLGKNESLLIQYQFSTYDYQQQRENWNFFGQLIPINQKFRQSENSQQFIINSDLRLIVSVFPYDRKLRHLGSFAKANGRLEALADIADVCDLAVEGVQVLAYRPERRAVLRLNLSRGLASTSVIAKLGQPKKLPSIFAKLKALAENGFHANASDTITVPRPLAYIPGKAILFEDVPGVSLHDAIGQPDFADGCGQAAQALKKLHRTRITDLPHYGTDDEIELLRSITARCADIYPQLEERLKQSLRLIEQTKPVNATEEPVVIHRDFYDKQVIIDEQRTTLLDIDTMSLGDAALDVGNFLAHLQFRGKQMPEHADSLKDGHRSFVETYNSQPSPFWKRASWWQTATLLRLYCLYCLRPPWHDLMTRCSPPLEIMSMELPSLLTTARTLA